MSLSPHHAAVLRLEDPTGDQLAVAVVELERFLSAELFGDLVGHATGSSVHSMSDACYQRWTDLAGVLAALPEPLEFGLVVGHVAHTPDLPAETRVGFLVFGRARVEDEAAGACRRAAGDLTRLLAAHLDYAEVRLLDDPAGLAPYQRIFELPHALELRRRRATLRIAAAAEQCPVGFRVTVDPEPSTRRRRQGRRGIDGIDHLYPWTPSDDTWRRLLSILRDEPGSAAFVVHAVGGAPVADAVPDRLHANLAAVERTRPDGSAALLADVLEILRRETLQQLVTVDGETLCLRVLLLTEVPPSAALRAIVARSVDDVAAGRVASSRMPLLRGGVHFRRVEPAEVIRRPDVADPDLAFGPREATAVLRTPMPSDAALPGLATSRARTAPFSGVSGDDTPLGTTNHRGSRQTVGLSGRCRFRHVYVIGQTGTGKSTLLARMALCDIAAGRGVAVLDPHGSLNDEILARIPADRIGDVVIVDVGDTEYPIGFNFLRLDESDPHAYVLARDLLIDELYAYVRRTYSFVPESMGPVFESHFRGMLALLLGASPPREPYIPNLMLFRPLYSSPAFLQAMFDSRRGQDPVIDDFVAEVARVHPHSEHSLQNIASYITSKVNRFISDTSLRNMTCQSRMLDMARIVAERRVLLFYLRRGRFGEYASGLLASQVVSRLRDVVMRRGADSGGPPFYVYVDEFQTFADDRIAELLSEARKFGLSLTLAHQFAGQLPSGVLRAVTGNVGTSVLFRVGPADAAALEALLAPTFRARDLVALDNYRAYVRGTDELGQTPFSLDTEPLAAPADRGVAAWARQFSRLAYGRPRAVVEVEIDNTYQAFKSLDDEEDEDDEVAIA
jgi:hypothetical protein